MRKVRTCDVAGETFVSLWRQHRDPEILASSDWCSENKVSIPPGSTINKAYIDAISAMTM